MKTANMRCLNCRHYDTELSYCTFFQKNEEELRQCEYWLNRSLYDHEKGTINE